MWIDVLSWTRCTSPPAWCQAFIHTMTPFSILTQHLREGEILTVYPQSQVSVNVCTSQELFCWRQTDTETQAEATEAQKWVAQNEWRKTWMGPILILLLLGTAIGALQLWNKALICAGFLEKHTCTISKPHHHQTLKRPGAWPGNSKDPQTQKEEFLTLVCANLTSFTFPLFF
jgi:hypothetical protein